MNLKWENAAVGAVVALALFLGGIGIGLSQSETKKVVVTFTETETTKRAPAACARAIDLSSQAFTRISDVMRMAAVDLSAFENAALDFQDWAKGISDELSSTTRECGAAVR